MQRIVFGLKDVYNAQCANAGIGLTSSALELNIPGLGYGYIAGGQDPIVSDIIRLDFATDTTSDTGNNMSRALTGCMGNGISSPNYGYFGGGFDASVPGHVCYIDRLDFSNETSAQLGSSMTQRRGNMGGTQTQDYGYLAGGFTPPTPAGYSTINRVDFSTETVTNLPATLPQARLNLNRVTSSSYGYFIGGQNPNQTCRIDRIDFSVETTSAPGNNVPVAYTAPMGNTQSQDYGYFAGGAPAGGGYTSDIFRIDFSDDTLSVPSANLSLARGDGSGVSSPSHGYWCGGYAGSYEDNIDKFEFNTETQSNPGNMPANRMGQFGVQINRPQVFKHVPGNNVWKEEPNYGYWGGGYGAPGNVNTVDRIDYASETVSAPGNNLIQTANATGAVQNSNYGYFASGQGPTAVCTISRLEFATETVINPTAKTKRSNPVYGGISAPDKGYFAGFGPEQCSVDRIDFTTETTTSNPSQLGQPKREPSGTQNNNYGYIMGGKSNAVPIDWSTINRVDFATDIFTTISSALPQGRRNTACVENTKNAYICLGSDSPVCTVERMEFSTETVSAINGFGPPRWAPGGNSSFSYGFVGGGQDPGIPENVSTINRLDFDTETSSTPSSKLTLGRRLVSAVQGGVSTRRVGKATRGYWAGGWTGSVNSRIDRMEFSTETIRNIGNLITATTDVASTQSDTYGYRVGGSTGSLICSIERLDFSNETSSSNPGQITQARRYLGSASNSNYGYFAGGNPYVCTVDRLDFYTDSVSAPGQNITQARGYFEGANNTSYGYFGGGYASPLLFHSTIDRIDFSNETILAPGSYQLTQPRENTAAFESSTYGYFFGGNIPGPTRVCTIDRIDFASETVSANPGQLSQARSGVRGSSDGDYGWMGGGAPPGYSSIIDRLDFASGTVSTPSQKLTQARFSMAAFSNG